MKSIERRFKNLEAKNPGYGAIICFSETIFGQGFNSQAIHRWFNRLVAKDDYASSDKRAILGQLEVISKPFDDNQK